MSAKPFQDSTVRAMNNIAKPQKNTLPWLIPTLTPKECELIERYLLDGFGLDDLPELVTGYPCLYCGFDPNRLTDLITKFCTGDQPHE